VSGEQSLQEVIAERNRLWEELQRRASVEADLEYWRTRAQDIERSRWWRAGDPFRLAKRALRDPESAFDALARRFGSERKR
jgi:hypothetical protein